MLALYRCGRQAEALEAFRAGARDARRADRRRAGPGAAAPARRDPAPGPGADRRAARRPSCRSELDAAAAPPLIGRDASCAGCATVATRRRGEAASSTLARRLRDGQDASRGRAGGRRPRERRGRALRVRLRAAEVALAAIARAADARRPTLLVARRRRPRADRGPARAARPRPARRSGARARDRPPGRRARASRAARVARARAARRRRGRAPSPPCTPRRGSAIPVEELLATSRGVPRRVHEAASEWARREATRRVDALAGRTAAGRSEAGRARGRAGRQRRRPAVDAASGSAARRAARRCGLPVQGPRDASTATTPSTSSAARSCRRAGRAARRRVAARRRRAVRERQVVGRAGRAAARARRRRAARQPELDAGRDPPWRAPDARAAARDRADSPRTRAACSSSTSSRSSSPPARTSASATSSSRRCWRAPRVVVAVRADFYGRCAAYPELSRALGANHVLVGAMSRDELRRAIERPAQRAGLASSPSSPTRCWPTSKASRARCRCSRRRCSSSGAGATAGACTSRPTRAAAASRARSRGWPRTRYVALDPAQQRERAPAAAAAERRGRERRDRAPPDRARRAGRRTSHRAAHRAPAADGQRGHGRGRARGAAARVAAAARLARGGRPGPPAAPAARRGRARLGRRRARPGRPLPRRAGWPPRSTGRPSTMPSSTPPSAPSSTPDGVRAGAPQRRLRLGSRGVGALLVLAVIAGAVALDQRDQARDAGDAPPTRSASARRRWYRDDLDRSLLLARQGVALEDSPQTRGNLLGALLKSPAAIGVLPGRRRVAGLASAPTAARSVTTGASAAGCGRRRPHTTVVARPVHTPAPWFRRHLRFDRASARGSRSALSRPSILDVRTWRGVTRLDSRAEALDLQLHGRPRKTLSVRAVVDDRRARRTTLRRAQRRAAAGTPRKLGRGFRRLASVRVTGDGKRVVMTGLEDGPTVPRRTTFVRCRSSPGRPATSCSPPTIGPCCSEAAAVRSASWTWRPAHSSRRGTARRCRRRVGLHAGRADPRHRRRGQPHPRLGRRARDRARDARRPHGPDHRTGAQPGRAHAVQRGLRRQGPDLGSRRRPAPRPPDRALAPGGGLRVRDLGSRDGPRRTQPSATTTARSRSSMCARCDARRCARSGRPVRTLAFMPDGRLLAATAWPSAAARPAFPRARASTPRYGVGFSPTFSADGRDGGLGGWRSNACAGRSRPAPRACTTPTPPADRSRGAEPRRARPRRADARRDRDLRRAAAASARSLQESTTTVVAAGIHARRALDHRWEPGRLDPVLVDRDRKPCLAQARCARGRGARAVGEPQRSHPGDRRR